MSYVNLPGGRSLNYMSSQTVKFDNYEDFPVKTVIPYLDDGFEYRYAVHLPKCGSRDMDKYFVWCFSNFGYAGFEVDIAGRRFFFHEEKHRTLFLLKWGHR